MAKVTERLFGKYVPHSRRSRTDDRWATYSQRKNEWIRKHPGATNREIDRAARAIAQALGL